MPRISRIDSNLQAAMNAFNSAGIDIHADYHTLDSFQSVIIAELARHHGYRKPKNANGSTARYYFAALQRAWNREHNQ